MVYIAPLSVTTLNDREGHFVYAVYSKPFWIAYLRKYSMHMPTLAMTVVDVSGKTNG